MVEMVGESKKIAVSAIKMAITDSIVEERELKEILAAQGITAAAVNYGGEAVSSVTKLIERAVIAAKREGVIDDTHGEEGAVAGAAHEALSQLMMKAIGLNIGGKIAIARKGEHLSVAIMLGIGMLHLNEVGVAVAHRALN